MRRFVVEPVVLAMFPELLRPPAPVEYVIPYSTIEELYLFRREKFLVNDTDHDQISQGIERLISFFESPFMAKKIKRITHTPWRTSSPMIWNESVTFTVVYAIEQEDYGEVFDPIETELILLAEWQNIPLLIEDVSLQNRIIEFEIPIQVFDVSDFDFAVEEAFSLQQESNERDTPFVLIKNDATAAVPLERKSLGADLPLKKTQEKEEATANKINQSNQGYRRWITILSCLSAILGIVAAISYKKRGLVIPLWVLFLSAYGWAFIFFLGINRFAYRIHRGRHHRGNVNGKTNRTEPFEE
ncbi:hypothetical protein DNHGIG_26790 [Collibacillus ludicampi]|uniref:Uncharacterized protein n=1 Tax=Collibacillus ludicampi TaxID=2771369 RepID=A0AAV4LH80_9BACL|nr:hypothetical protein [Collibacillus ludicampi]GIM47130.1 hypothetical protein DNHGIG_26790 [Collibacillus ludicampi]